MLLVLISSTELFNFSQMKSVKILVFLLQTIINPYELLTIFQCCDLVIAKHVSKNNIKNFILCKMIQKVPFIFKAFHICYIVKNVYIFRDVIGYLKYSRQNKRNKKSLHASKMLEIKNYNFPVS